MIGGAVQVFVLHVLQHLAAAVAVAAVAAVVAIRINQYLLSWVVWQLIPFHMKRD